MLTKMLDKFLKNIGGLLMTYRELSDWLLTLNDDQLDFMDVTIYDPWRDEHHAVSKVKITSEANDVLDKSHPILVLMG